MIGDDPRKFMEEFQKAFQEATRLARFAAALLGAGHYKEVCLQNYVEISQDRPGKKDDFVGPVFGMMVDKEWLKHHLN